MSEKTYAALQEFRLTKKAPVKFLSLQIRAELYGAKDVFRQGF
jgi:hypothetical protein